MKRVVVLSIVLSFAFAWIAQGSAQELEGNKRYTPTRLEWLVVLLNACYREAHAEYAIIFAPRWGEDTIEMLVVYQKTVDRAAINEKVDDMRKKIHLMARHHGWNHWLKIRERVTMID